MGKGGGLLSIIVFGIIFTALVYDVLHKSSATYQVAIGGTKAYQNVAKTFGGS